MGRSDNSVRTETRQTDEKAVSFVTGVFNEFNWEPSPIPPPHDYGCDLLVTMFKSRTPRTSTPGEFYVQVRGTRTISGGSGSVTTRIERKHIRYWKDRAIPVLLVVCDVRKETGYWLWIEDYLKDMGSRSLNAMNPTIRIPRTNQLTRDTTTMERLRRHVGRKVWQSVHARLSVPTSLTVRKRKEVFPFKLEALPFPFVDEHARQLDVLLISGAARYELELLESRFTRRSGGFVDVQWGTKIVLGESARNLALCSEILGALSLIAGEKGFTVATKNERAHLSYLDVTEDLLSHHNLICIPCGDVNPLLPMALKDFEMRFLVRCPVHPEPYDSSESIKSEITGSSFEKYRRQKWAGYIVLLPNPWNPEKALLVCGGNKGVGTQAALLRLLGAIRGERKLKNHKGFPGRVVVPKFDAATLMVHGVSDFE